MASQPTLDSHDVTNHSYHHVWRANRGRESSRVTPYVTSPAYRLARGRVLFASTAFDVINNRASTALKCLYAHPCHKYYADDTTTRRATNSVSVYTTDTSLPTTCCGTTASSTTMDSRPSSAPTAFGSSHRSFTSFAWHDRSVLDVEPTASKIRRPIGHLPQVQPRRAYRP